MSTVPTSRPGGTSYEEVQAGDEFVQLRTRFRGFVFPVTAGFLIWYFLFVLMSAYAKDFMSTKVIGNINVGHHLRAAAVRQHVRDHHLVRAVGRPRARPHRRRAARAHRGR